MPSVPIPIPPVEMRRLVGPSDPGDFDNPHGELLYGNLVPSGAYDAIFDFGCGCGREARRLLLQKPRPRRYVGIDAHRGMIEWCARNLAPVDAGFKFEHHDVYSPTYAPENRLRLAASFPVGDGEFSLLVAISVFTHLCNSQAEYYLSEAARILRPDGLALTTWFFFDRDSFPFLQEGPYSLYTSESDFAQAVIYDRRWFLETVRRFGLGVRNTVPPVVPGHQWNVLLEKRTPETVDQFPLGEDGAQWLCGATSRPAATVPIRPELMDKIKGRPTETACLDPADRGSATSRPEPPALFGTLAQLDLARVKLDAAREPLRRLVRRAGSASTRILRALFRSSSD